jgi:hypothetical protein
VQESKNIKGKKTLEQFAWYYENLGGNGIFRRNLRPTYSGPLRSIEIF